MTKLLHILAAAFLLAMTSCSCLPGGRSEQGLSVQRDQPSQILSKDEIPQASGN